MFAADPGKCPGIRRVLNMETIRRDQEIHSMHRRNGDVRHP
jgi:hypothetical protein